MRLPRVTAHTHRLAVPGRPHMHRARCLPSSLIQRESSAAARHCSRPFPSPLATRRKNPPATAASFLLCGNLDQTQQLVVLAVVLIASLSCGAVGILDSTIGPLCGRDLTLIEQVYWVLLPFIPVIVVIFTADTWLIKYIAEKLLATQKVSENLKDNMRSSWEVMGVVAALLLSLDTSALIGQGPYTSLSQLWYVVMLWLSMGYSLRAVAYASLSMLYTNVFDDDGKTGQFKTFIKDNSELIGSPTSGIAVTMFTTCAAANLYVYQSAGIVVGILTNVLWAAILYLIVITGLTASNHVTKLGIAEAAKEVAGEVEVATVEDIRDPALKASAVKATPA